jgi:RNA polymerase sigma factor (TIGR02999 family)
MSDGSSKDLTRTLLEADGRPGQGVVDDLMPAVYDELKALAQKYLLAERRGHSLQPTALVHEAYLKLINHRKVDWKGRTHFFAVGAAAMRRILIDHARTKGRKKRGGSWERIIFDDAELPGFEDGVDTSAVHDALEVLSNLDPEQAQVVELRFFGGMTVEEVAYVMGVSKRKIEGEWTHAKAWLRHQLDPDHAE